VFYGRCPKLGQYNFRNEGGIINGPAFFHSDFADWFSTSTPPLDLMVSVGGGSEVGRSFTIVGTLGLHVGICLARRPDWRTSLSARPDVELRAAEGWGFVIGFPHFSQTGTSSGKLRTLDGS